MRLEAGAGGSPDDNFLGRQLRQLGRLIGRQSRALGQWLAGKRDAARLWWGGGGSPDGAVLAASATDGAAPGVRVEDKLFQNRYLVDAGRAHIKVRPHAVPSPQLISLLKACPARCYGLNEKGQVEITVDGCVECGTCRIIGEPTGDIEWSYPRGGYGVLFKFG